MLRSEDRGPTQTGAVIEANVDELFSCASQLRDRINMPARKDRLMADAATWFQICAALDVLEDAGYAVQAWTQRLDEPSFGAVYLQTYGLLQALTLQRQALISLEKALIDHERPTAHSDLNRSNEVRNKAVGHPTRRDQPKGTLEFHGIIRGTMSGRGFDLNSFGEQLPNRFVSERIELEPLVASHLRAVVEVATAICSDLDDESATDRP